MKDRALGVREVISPDAAFWACAHCPSDTCTVYSLSHQLSLTSLSSLSLPLYLLYSSIVFITSQHVVQIYYIDIFLSPLPAPPSKAKTLFALAHSCSFGREETLESPRDTPSLVTLEERNKNQLLIRLRGRWRYSNERMGTQRQGVTDAEFLWTQRIEWKGTGMGMKLGQVRGRAGQFGNVSRRPGMTREASECGADWGTKGGKAEWDQHWGSHRGRWVINFHHGLPLGISLVDG